jgi:uncharacterized protein (DUF1800 family)
MRTDQSIRTGRALSLALAAAAITTLVACAARSGTAIPPRPAATQRHDAAAGERAILHLLNRVSFGPRPGDVEAVERMGVPAYLDLQLHPDRIDDSRLEARLVEMPSLTVSPQTIAEEYVKPAELERRRRLVEATEERAAPGTPRPPEPEAFKREREVLVELAAQKILRAAFSERQLQEVLVDFWFNHFNVFVGKGADRLYVGEYERLVIRPRVLGRFRDLLGAVAQSPAMLFYLDNWMSVDPNGVHPPGMSAPRPPGPVARPAVARVGLNENYARELMELHTLGVDGGYTQHDVIEVARCFTGWTIDKPASGGGFLFDPRRHDEGRKVVLGRVIEPRGGERDGEQVLDILAASPATARHVATELARRFVADDPPPALVDRVAARFLATGGDLREVVREVLTLREFASSAAQATVKTPLEFVVSAMRATDARIDDAAPAVNELRLLGMPVYGCLPPTGYAGRADAWVTAGSLLDRMNFASALVSNRLRGISVDLPALAGSTDPVVARASLVRQILGPDVSPGTAAVLARQTALSGVAALALGSPDFQRR